MRRTSNLGLLIVVRGGHYQGFHWLLLWSISSGWQLDTVNTETFTPTWLILVLFLYYSYLSTKLWWVNQENFFDHKLKFCQRDTSPRLSCSVLVSATHNLIAGATDQRQGFASFIWIFQWWKWKFWPLENLIKFSYLSRCSLSWTTYIFCCYMLQKLFCPSKNISQLSEWQVSTLNCPIYK